jgi:hypothetical protein
MGTATARFAVGEVMSGPQLDSLPLGAVVQSPQGDVYEKVQTNPRKFKCVQSKRVRAGLVRPLREDYNTLISLPWRESFEEFKARFARRVTEVAAEFSAEHQRLAAKALRDLGAVDTPVGQPVTPMLSVPNGTVAVEGAPDQVGFTIWRMEQNRWRRTYGPGESVSSAHVSSIPAQPRIGGPRDLAEFKRQVWNTGQRIKQDHKWCSAYDRLLAEFDITDPEPWPDLSAWAHRLVKGEKGRAKCADGAILGVTKGDWGIFVKVNGVWVRAAGTRPEAAGTMVLLGQFYIIDTRRRLDQFLPDWTRRGLRLYPPDLTMAWEEEEEEEAF